MENSQSYKADDATLDLAIRQIEKNKVAKKFIEEKAKYLDSLEQDSLDLVSTAYYFGVCALASMLEDLEQQGKNADYTEAGYFALMCKMYNKLSKQH